MAYDTAHLDGTVVAPGGAYPFGDLKNAPSGTRVNKKMVADMWQFFQKAMFETSITPNNLPDNNANNYQLYNAVVDLIATNPTLTGLISTLNSQVGTLQTEVALNAWTAITITGTQWSAYNSPRYTKDGKGRVYLQGSVQSTGTTPAGTIGTLPSGYRPTQDVYFPCMMITAGGTVTFEAIAISTAGDIVFATTAHLPTASGWLVYFDPILFLTL